METKNADMVTAAEYAEIIHKRPETVLSYIKKGYLQGVTKEPLKVFGRFRYMIPRDAQPQFPEPEPPPTRPLTRREQYALVRKYCGTKTYGELSRLTGATLQEIRAMYEHIHSKYHV